MNNKLKILYGFGFVSLFFLGVLLNYHIINMIEIKHHINLTNSARIFENFMIAFLLSYLLKRVYNNVTNG